MARQFISYEMAMMLVAPTGVTNPIDIAKLDFIQSYNFSFNLDRAPLKQIGSTSFASRQSQLAPDVDFNLEYYLNNGWNEKYVGLDINTAAYGNPFAEIFSSNKDKNFYVLINPDNYNDSNADSSIDVLESPEFDNYNLLGIGNAYISNFEINISNGELAKVNTSFVAANAQISTIGDNSSFAFLSPPNVNTTGDGSQYTSPSLFPVKNILNGKSRTERYMSGYKEIFDGGCSHGNCSITASPAVSDAVRLGFDFDNFQSLSISIPFERKALYGFGNNYPFNRKLQKPIIGTINLDSMVDTFYAENLAATFVAEDVSISGYNFDIMFGNQTGKNKMGVKIQNAKMDSYSIGLSIGDKSLISTTWSFEVTESTGILISGSYAPPTPIEGFITEAINL